MVWWQFSVSILLSIQIVTSINPAPPHTFPPTPEIMVISALVDVTFNYPHSYFFAAELTACTDIANLLPYTFRPISDQILPKLPPNNVPNIKFRSRIYIGTTLQRFQEFFGFTPQYFVSFSEFTVDERVLDFELLYRNKSIDTYDDSTPGSFASGWAKRLPGTPPTNLFNPRDWNITPNAYAIQETQNIFAKIPIRLGTYTCPLPTRSPSKQPTHLPSLPPSLPPAHLSEMMAMSALVDHLLFAVLELTACTDIGNFNEYYLDYVGSIASTHLQISSDNNTQVLPAGSKLYVVTTGKLNAASFNAFFGFTPLRLYSLRLSLDSPDLQLLHGFMVEDHYNGTITNAQFLDGWATRKLGTLPSASFNVADWTVTPNAYLSTTATNSNATVPVRLGTYSCIPATPRPTPIPTALPTHSPTLPPSIRPTQRPTAFPTQPPTHLPTKAPTLSPTRSPTDLPTQQPTLPPSLSPTRSPTVPPTDIPTMPPTISPTLTPTQKPSVSPTRSPTRSPTEPPTMPPTQPPTAVPTALTSLPTAPPTPVPLAPVKPFKKTNPPRKPTLKVPQSAIPRPTRHPVTPFVRPSPTTLPTIAPVAPSPAPVVPSSTPSAAPTTASPAPHHIPNPPRPPTPNHRGPVPAPVMAATPAPTYPPCTSYSTCPTAQVITTGITPADGSCIQESPSVTILACAPGTETDFPGAWFSFTPATSCMATVTATATGMSRFTPLLYLYDGTCSTLVCDTSITSGSQNDSTLTWSATMGTTYYIYMYPSGLFPTLTYEVNVMC